jgi:hypothetical protein
MQQWLQDTMQKAVCSIMHATGSDSDANSTMSQVSDLVQCKAMSVSDDEKCAKPRTAFTGVSTAAMVNADHAACS